MNALFFALAVANTGHLTASKSEGFLEEEWKEKVAQISQAGLHLEIMQMVSRVPREDARALLGDIFLRKIRHEIWGQFLVEQTKTDKDENGTFISHYGYYACALKHVFRCYNLPIL